MINHIHEITFSANNKPQNVAISDIPIQNNHVNKINLNNSKPQDVATSVTHIWNNDKIKSVTILNTSSQKNNTAINPSKPPHESKTSDTKQLPFPIKDSKAIISPPKINYFRKVTLKDADIDNNTKKQLDTMCNDYTDISSKHATDIQKTDLVQMSLNPKDNIKALDQKLYMLFLWHHACLWQELTGRERAGIISPCISNVQAQ